MGTETRAMPRMKSFMFFAFAFFCMSIPSIVPSCQRGGDRQQAVGSGQWAVGSGQWAVGSGQWAVGSGQWAAGSGQWAAGSGQWAVGSGQWAAGSNDRNNQEPPPPVRLAIRSWHVLAAALAQLRRQVQAQEIRRNRRRKSTAGATLCTLQWMLTFVMGTDVSNEY